MLKNKDTKLLLPVSLILSIFMITFSFKESYLSFSNVNGYYLFGMFLYLFFAFIFACALRPSVLNRKKDCSKEELFSWFKSKKNKETILFQFPPFFISPNYFWVSYFKNSFSNYCCCKELYRKIYIVTLNRCNFIFSIILLVLVFILQSCQLNDVLLGFVVYRTISRSFEIIIAFGKDALSKEKKSTLDRFDRVKLAIVSYFEIIINFTVAYYLIFINHFERTSQIIDVFLFSFHISTLTGVSHEIGNDAIIILSVNKLLIGLQIISVLTLVVLSLAMYASDSQNTKQ